MSFLQSLNGNLQVVAESERNYEQPEHPPLKLSSHAKGKLIEWNPSFGIYNITRYIIRHPLNI